MSWFRVLASRVRSWADLDLMKIQEFLGRFKELAAKISIDEAQLIASELPSALFLFLDSAQNADPEVVSTLKKTSGDTQNRPSVDT